MTAVRATLTSEFQGSGERSARRLPVAVGLALGGLVSAGLWALIVVACLKAF
jgi:hypothetical protein